MIPLQVVVLERDGGIRSALAASLRDQGVEHVGEAVDREKAVRLCAASPVSLLLCGGSDGVQEWLTLLRDIAALRPAPAVAFLDAGSKISQYESLCLNLNLNYLGQLTAPIDPSRLGRMLRLVRTYREEGGQS